MPSSPPDKSASPEVGCAGGCCQPRLVTEDLPEQDSLDANILDDCDRPALDMADQTPDFTIQPTQHRICVDRKPHESTPSTSRPMTADSCPGGCCGSQVESKAEDNCCGEKNDDLYRRSGCCSGSSGGTKLLHSSDKPNGCDTTTNMSGGTHEPNSLSALPACGQIEHQSPPSDACLDRVALRECQENCNETESTATGSNSRDPTEAKRHPCKAHQRSIRDKYSAILEAVGCLCRTLIAQGQQSCCVSSTQQHIDREKDAQKYSKLTYSDTSMTKSPRPAPVGTVDKCREGCCDTATTELPLEISSSSGEAKKTAMTTMDSDRLETKTLDISNINVENGLTGKEEHVILSISGMTCSGCETKLKRSLTHLEHVKNVKTSLVLCRAEFDIDLGRGKVDETINQLVRATGFQVERIANQGAEIDVRPRFDLAEYMEQELPLGVHELNKLDKRTVRIRFDPKVVGARQLMGGDVFKQPALLAPPQPDPALSAGRKHVIHVGFMTLLSILLTIPVLVMSWAPVPSHPVTYGSASLALATIIQVVIAGPFYPDALKALIFSRMIEMDLLIVLSTSAAYIFSVVAFGYLVAGDPLSTGEFFETSTLLVTLIMVGRFLSALARLKPVESISIRSLQTPKALLTEDLGASTTEIDARLLQFGDCFKVMPESRIPTDGTVICGSSEVDESMITGESIPVAKAEKSAVIAGSVNGSGMLVVRLSRLPGDNTITTIAAMVDEAKLSKPRIQQIADRVAGYFVPVVVALALITFVIWIAVGLKVRNLSGSEASVDAITYAITVLIVSCPCAIGLAVPMVVVIASGVAAEHGLIIKTAETIESARKVTHVVLDKTGTLTEGKLKVERTKFITEDDPAGASSIMAGLVADVKHPVSVAVATMLTEKGVKPAQIADVKTVSGHGIEGTYHGQIARAGNMRWLDHESHPVVQSFLAEGYTVMGLLVNSSLSMVLGLQDSLRPSAFPTISILRNRDIKMSIVSGDDIGPVRSTAQRLGISEYRAQCNPRDKQAYLQDIVKGNPRAITLFIGDGTNDAIALAQATIGVHISEGGTDVAAGAADVVLARPDLMGLTTLIDLSQAAVRRIGFNFAWSFVYNVLAILLASGALVNVRLPPQFGGLGELVSVLPVVIIALQLKWAKSARARKANVEVSELSGGQASLEPVN